MILAFNTLTFSTSLSLRFCADTHANFISSLTLLQTVLGVRLRDINYCRPADQHWPTVLSAAPMQVIYFSTKPPKPFFLPIN